MKTRLKTRLKFLTGESGITALETAIILIAFVVVAAIFAFTTLSTGTFLTERSKETSYQGLAEVRGSMELRGSVLITTTGTMTYAVFTVANVAGGQPVDLNDTPGQQVTKIFYRDTQQTVDLNVGGMWTVQFLAKTDGDKVLDGQELAQITVDLSSLPTPLQPNMTFDIEVKPPQGAVILIERVTPPSFQPVNDLK